MSIGLLFVSSFTVFPAAKDVNLLASQSQKRLEVASEPCAYAARARVNTILGEYLLVPAWDRKSQYQFFPLVEVLGISEAQSVVIKLHISKIINYSSSFRSGCFFKELHACYLHLREKLSLELSDDPKTWEGYVVSSEYRTLKCSVILCIPMNQLEEPVRDDEIDMEVT
jgi:hypothetical protein